MNSYKEDRTRFEVITLLAAKSSRTDWGIKKHDVQEAFRVVGMVDFEMEKRRDSNE